LIIYDRKQDFLLRQLYYQQPCRFVYVPKWISGDISEGNFPEETWEKIQQRNGSIFSFGPSFIPPEHALKKVKNFDPLLLISAHNICQGVAAEMLELTHEAFQLGNRYMFMKVSKTNGVFQIAALTSLEDILQETVPSQLAGLAGEPWRRKIIASLEFLQHVLLHNSQEDLILFPWLSVLRQKSVRRE